MLFENDNCSPARLSAYVIIALAVGAACIWCAYHDVDFKWLGLIFQTCLVFGSAISMAKRLWCFPLSGWLLPFSPLSTLPCLFQFWAELLTGGRFGLRYYSLLKPPLLLFFPSWRWDARDFAGTAIATVNAFI